MAIINLHLDINENYKTYINDIYKLLKPGERYTFFIGFTIEFENKYVAIVKDKGGLANKHGLHTLGGVYDSGYRGEYNICLKNLSNEAYQIKKGDKLAQLIFLPFEQAELIETEELTSSSRAGGRFGSTGR